MSDFNHNLSDWNKMNVKNKEYYKDLFKKAIFLPCKAPKC